MTKQSSGGSISLHPKHGLNPTIPACFYCGKDKDMIALLGAEYKEEAPMHMVIDIEPCDQCKEKYADYTLLVEVKSHDDYLSAQRRKKHPQPTGRWCAIRKECLNIAEPSPVAYVGPETMNFLLEKNGV